MKSLKISNKHKFLILIIILIQVASIFSGKVEAKNPNMIIPPVIPMATPLMVILNKSQIQ